MKKEGKGGETVTPKSYAFKANAARSLQKHILPAVAFPEKRKNSFLTQQDKVQILSGKRLQTNEIQARFGLYLSSMTPPLNLKKLTTNKKIPRKAL